jgi:uncharacterized protein (DUF58 family)
MTLRRSFWGVLFLLVISGLVAYFTPVISGVSTPVFFTRLVYLSVLLIAIGYAWAYVSTRGITLLREARVLRHQVGQIFEERFKLVNRMPFARLWVEIRDDSQLPGKSGSRVLSQIGPRQQRSYIAYTMLNRRGSFKLGPTNLISGDPFGLFTFTKVEPVESTLVVLPYIVNLRDFPSPMGMFPGGRAIRRKAHEVTPQAAGVREYAPGDALRRIHWPTSARKDRLMTKEFDQDPQADVWIFLDAYAPVHFSQLEEKTSSSKVDQLWMWQRKSEVTLPADTFEYAVSAAGSIASYYLKQGRTVGFISAGDVLTVHSPERGERQLTKVLETLTFLQPDGDLPLAGLIEAQAPSLPRASTVVLITPSTHESLELGVDYLIMRSLRPVLVTIDARSFGGNLGGEEIIPRLKQRNIPIISLSKDQDLNQALETENL